MNRRFRHIDWKLLFTTGLLALVGLLVIYSTTADTPREPLFLRHAISLGAGLVCLIGATLIPYRFLEGVSYYVYGLTVATLVLVLIIGAEESGAQRWIILGPFRLQPSEAAKIATLMALARFLASKRRQPSRPLTALKALGFLILPVGGYSKGFLGIDHLMMVTPLYVRTKSISHHPTDPVTFTTHYFLWPFIAVGSDGRPGGRRKFRVIPFYGRSTGPGDSESLFVMWPFYNYKRVGKTRGWFSFPFYGRTESPTRRETTILWPIYHRNVDYLTGATDTALWPI